MRSSCLLALKELLEAQPERFRPYAELTILSLLEFEKDTDREVRIRKTRKLPTLKLTMTFV